MYIELFVKCNAVSRYDWIIFLDALSRSLKHTCSFIVVCHIIWHIKLFCITIWLASYYVVCRVLLCAILCCHISLLTYIYVAMQRKLGTSRKKEQKRKKVRNYVRHYIVSYYIQIYLTKYDMTEHNVTHNTTQNIM